MLYDPNWKQSEVTLEPWQQALMDAIKKLNTEGWVQGNYRSGHAYCLYGAVAESSPSVAVRSQILGELARELSTNRYGGIRYMGLRDVNIISWNDHPGRTKEEVIELLFATATRKLPE